MKTKDIQLGYYYDGKNGVRQIISVDVIQNKVKYRILAAKVEREFDRHGEAHSLIGNESDMDLTSFAAWAKSQHSLIEADAIIDRLRAQKVKLAPGEEAFLASVRQEIQGVVTPGTTVSYDHTEGRAVSGLEKKGLLRRLGAGECQILGLGAARLNAAAEG
jgi:hypothetical protein